MGPISTLLCHQFSKYRNPSPETRKAGMTKIQIQALDQVSKGNIRPASDRFCLILKEGVFGRGGQLVKARFSPFSLRSLRNAEIFLRETAKGKYRFDLLFVDNGLRGERLHVLCPECREYWTWNAYLPNDLRNARGRICRYCLRGQCEAI